MAYLDILKKPAAAVFRAAVNVRAKAYAANLLTPVRLDGIKVISVGNLTVGGSGKTPFAMYLAERLQQKGYRTALVLRGYQGTMESKGGIVSAGNGPLMEAIQAGDEAYLVAARTRGISVYVGADRVRSAVAAGNSGIEIAVLDDGFSHRRMHRNLDILLASPDDLATTARFFPSGRLREPPGAAARAHLIGGFADEWQAQATDFTFNYIPIDAMDLNQRRHPLDALPRKVHLLSAVARPDRFRRTVEAEGFQCVGHSVFRDHHRFSQEELRVVFSQAAANTAEAVITTEKDWVRIPKTRPPLPVLALRIDMQLVSGEEKIDAALDRLR